MIKARKFGSTSSLEGVEGSNQQENIVSEMVKPSQKSQNLNEQTQTWDSNNRDARLIYHNLHSADEIRLLHLQPKSNGEAIKCTIEHAKIASKQSYEALSYMWGPSDFGQPIFINETVVNVRLNLWVALQHLRLNTEIRLLWIDAICINQNDTRERNHQVAQMSEIYHQATRVVVWLGPSDATSKIAFEALNLSARQWAEFFEPSNDLAMNSKKINVLMALHTLLTRGYWKRLWIIQEFLMAREFIIQCGDDSCHSSRICWIIIQLGIQKTMKKYPDNAVPTTYRMRSIVIRMLDKTIPARLIRQRLSVNLFRHVKSSLSQPIVEPLFKLFSVYNEAHCTDQRDKIFGLHSLASACCREANPIDYCLTWEATLNNLLRHQLNFHYSLPYGLKYHISNLTGKEFLERPVYDYQANLAVRNIQFFNSKVKKFLGQSHANHGMLDVDAINASAQTRIHWTDIQPSLEISQPKAVILLGYARGRIFYRSPVLSQPFCHDHLKLPELTPFLKCQIMYICSLNDPQTDHQHATRETDVVGIITQGRLPDFVYGRRGTTKIFSKKYHPICYQGKNAGTVLNQEYDEHKLLKNFSELLHYAQTCAGANQVLAFEDNGLIFFAPEDIREGDIVCQFTGSDILAIIQPRHDINRETGNMTAWRAVNFLASPSDMAADICGKPMSFDRTRQNSHAIEFISGQQFITNLCRMSDTPNGDHNILQSNLK